MQNDDTTAEQQFGGGIEVTQREVNKERERKKIKKNYAHLTMSMNIEVWSPVLRYAAATHFQNIEGGRRKRERESEKTLEKNCSKGRPVELMTSDIYVQTTCIQSGLSRH